jgi:ATP-dependent Clp protease ATP-binding subunit ClpX
MRYGMIPEFVGRFQNWVSLAELSKQDLVQILTQVRHSYISQYSWLFNCDNVELTFTDASLDLIAERTLKNKTGARGLHSELERVLLPHMFYLRQYHKQGIKTVTIDVDQVADPVALKVSNL